MKVGDIFKTHWNGKVLAKVIGFKDGTIQIKVLKYLDK
jgi:hypothetical protein